MSTFVSVFKKLRCTVLEFVVRAFTVIVIFDGSYYFFFLMSQQYTAHISNFDIELLHFSSLEFP